MNTKLSISVALLAALAISAANARTFTSKHKNGDLEPEYILTNETIAKDNPNFFASTVNPDGSGKAKQNDIINGQKDSMPDNGVYTNVNNEDVYTKTFDAPTKVVNKTGTYDHTELQGAKITVYEGKKTIKKVQTKKDAFRPHYIWDGNMWIQDPADSERLERWKQSHAADGIWMGDGEYKKIVVDLPVKTIYKAPPPPPPTPTPPSGGGTGGGGDTWKVVEEHDWVFMSKKIGSGKEHGAYTSYGYWHFKVYDEPRLVISQAPPCIYGWTEMGGGTGSQNLCIDGNGDLHFLHWESILKKYSWGGERRFWYILYAVFRSGA